MGENGMSQPNQYSKLRKTAFGLSDRELLCVLLVAQSVKRRRIARALGIGITAVDLMIKKAVKVLGINPGLVPEATLTRWAMEAGLLS